MPPETASGVNHTVSPPSLGLGGATETEGVGTERGMGEQDREGPRAAVPALDLVAWLSFKTTPISFC